MIQLDTPVSGFSTAYVGIMRIINLNPHTVMLQNHVYNLIEQMAHE